MVMYVSEGRVCRVAGEHRSIQHRPVPPDTYRNQLVARMRELAVDHPRRGHCYIIDLMHKEGWSIGTRLMKCVWRAEGMLAPQKRRKRRRSRTGKIGIVCRRATRKDQVWGMDFVSDYTSDGRAANAGGAGRTDGDLRSAGAHSNRQRTRIRLGGGEEVVQVDRHGHLYINPGSPWQN
jgi:hypothetical protein